ncbi:helix-turn-helix domain-containing protein [Massilia sp. CT11-137]|jgi:transcriptional regulator with XRE-family HTH domain|uniref:helix-turn-helix domain-containing protein n=1 Tax=Massilia sp. CT11-137 TaxID=3393901 RepID=UPI0039A6EBEA
MLQPCGVPTTYTKNESGTPARILFGAALRRARLELKMSQEELAFRAGLNRTYIGHVERGEKNISIGNMEHLAHAVGMPLWQMIRPPEPADGS